MSEKELKLFEAAMDLAIGECCSDSVEDIKRLETKIKLIDGLYKQQKEVIDKIFSRITLLKMEDITIETNKVLDELLDILKEVSE